MHLKGNAYGSFFGYDPIDAFLCQASYTDPHIARTLDVISRTADYVRKTEWTQADIDGAINSRAGNFLKTLRPGQAAIDALTNHLTGQTPEAIEEKYSQL